jgi:small subunit ribosomal protein S6
MRNYDVSLIFSPLLEEQAVNDVLQQLASFVQEKGGILGDQQIKGKRPLLAPIGKHKEGYLALFSFNLSPELLEEFEKYCKEQKDILRFLIAKHVKQRQNKKQPTLAQKQAIPAKPQSEESPSLETADVAAVKEEKSDRPTEEKIDLKDIDEELEEIFKETS